MREIKTAHFEVIVKIPEGKQIDEVVGRVDTALSVVDMDNSGYLTISIIRKVVIEYVK